MEKKNFFGNIFIKTCTKSLNAGNTIGKISDHLPKLLTIQNLKGERIKIKKYK